MNAVRLGILSSLVFIGCVRRIDVYKGFHDTDCYKVVN